MKRDPNALGQGEPTHRKALTRERILEAALDLFAARGYDRTTIERVARRAGVSRAAVFWHFGDKRSLFLEACARLLSPFREALARSIEHLDPEKRLTEMFDVYQVFVTDNRDAIQALVRWMIESTELRSTLRDGLFALHTEFREDLRKTLAEVLPADRDPAVLAAGLVALLDGHLLLGLLDPGAPQARYREGLQEILKLLPHRSEKS